MGERSPGLILAVTLAVVFGIAALVLGILLAAGSDDGDDRTEELRRAAGEFGEAFFTFDFEDPEAHEQAVLSRATGSFRSEYEEAFAGLLELITETQATSEGTVKDVYVSQIDEERGEAIVVADAERDGAGGPRTVFDLYVKLTMVEVDGGWKVDEVTDLTFAPASPTATTTAPSTDPVP